MCPCAWFGVFGPSFSKLPQYLSTCETGIIQPTEGLDASIRSHLMWNKELKILDFFSCHSVLDLGVLGPFPPKLPQSPSTQRTGINQSSDNLSKRVRPHLMWNVELNTLGMFLYVIWGTWVHFLQIYLMPKYPIAATTWPTDSFYTRLRSDWMWSVVLKTLYYFLRISVFML